MSKVRLDGRGLSQIRPIKLQYDVYGYADASVLFEIGNTKVLVAVTLQQTVPVFLKGQRTGWLSAEYAMLPSATQQRTQRESSMVQRNSRSVEISRLIGRCLRTVVNLDKLGERSILVDCDVLQADGGTRVASITAASLAINQAVIRWVDAGVLEENILKESVAAISVGAMSDCEIVDLDFNEDKDADADFNFVMTQSGGIVEIQGTCEKGTISTDKFDKLKNLAASAIENVFAECAKFEAPRKAVQINTENHKSPSHPGINQKPGMFSLANRLNRAY